MRSRGFTIVELLIVIVVIAILAAISVVAYNGIQERSRISKRNSDLATLYKAILLARESQGKVLGSVTNDYYSAGFCIDTASNQNPSSTPPRDLPKTHNCWVRYYNTLTTIGQASGMNLDGLRAGDGNGQPYLIDENEGENGACGNDVILYYANTSNTASIYRNVPRAGFTGCTPG